MLVAEGINRLFPNLDDIEDGILEYRRFYSEKEEKEYGVVAIEIKLI